MEFQLSGDFNEMFRRATKIGLLRAAEFLVGELRNVLSTVNPGKSVKYSRPSKSGAKSHSVYGSPSVPGEAPRQRTGWGKGHVGFEASDDGMSVRIGVPEAAIYLAYHEAGINYRIVGKQQRPWLVDTVEKYLPVLERLFMTGAIA